MFQFLISKYICARSIKIYRLCGPNYVGINPKFPIIGHNC